MKLKQILPLLTIALLTLLTACNDYKSEQLSPNLSSLPSKATYDNQQTTAMELPAGTTEQDENATSSSLLNNTQQLKDNTNLPPKTKIIKIADIKFQVQNVEKTQKNIAQLVQKNGAYISSENATKTDLYVEYQMVIRTNQNFDTIINQVLTQSVYTDYKRITAEDVTEQYTDIATRLKTKKDVEQRYLAILKQASKITDILSVERELKQIREEIEAAEGKLRYLSDRIAYSTITLNFYEKLNYSPTPTISFFNRLYQAIHNGFKGFLNIIIDLVSIWHLILLAIITFFLLKKWWNRKTTSTSFFSKKNKKTPHIPPTKTTNNP